MLGRGTEGMGDRGTCTHLVPLLAELTGGTHGRPCGCPILEAGRGKPRGEQCPAVTGQPPPPPRHHKAPPAPPYPVPWLVTLPRRWRW